MMLVERDDALGALRRLLGQSAAGQGRVALVTGGLATGKSELLRVFAEDAAVRGALVLSAAGSRAEQSLQMGVMCQIVHGPAFPDIPVPTLSTVDSVPWDEVDPDPAVVGPLDATIIRDMCAAVLQAARQNPVVIAIDDVQFVDGASLRALLYMRRRMAGAPVFMVLAGWEQRRRAWPSFRAEITRQPHEQVRLAPLSEQGVTEMVAARIESPHPGLAGFCSQLSGGNPLLASALIEDNQAMPGGEPMAGVAYTQAVLTCLHRGEPQLLDVASAVAVLGEQAPPALVGKLVGETVDEITPTFEALRAAGVFGAQGFRHPAAAATVVDSLRPGERSRMHLSAANLLHQQGAGALEIARHLVLADAACGPWAVELLREAAERALADDDVATAAHCLRLALRDSTHEDIRHEITKSLARVEWRVNPAAAALHLEPLHDSMRAGTLGRRDAATLARQALWQGDSTTVIAAMKALESDAQTAAELRLVFEWIHGSQQGLPSGDRPATPGNPWVQVAGKLNGLMVKGRAEDVAGSAEHILQSCHLGDTTLEVVVAALFALAYADKADKASFWCEALTEEAERRNAPTWQALLTAVRADIALRQGDLAFAEKHAVAALGLIPAEGWGVLIGLPRATLLLAYTGMGKPEAAAEVLKQFVPAQMFRTVIGLRYLHARGHYYLSADRALAALDDFQTCDRQMREWNIDVPALVPALTDLAQGYLQLEQRKLARDLVTRQLERPRAISSRTRGVALRVLAATTELRQRPQLLMEAIEDLHNSGDRLELARALIDLSEAHQELGEFSRARMHARRAAAEAKACHAEPLSKLLSHGGTFEVKEPRVEAEGVPPLSGAERRVATLAARGYSNREIGRMLYITVSTVEQHLTRVYRKLNVGSRADLPVGLLLSRVPATGPQQSTMSTFE